MRLWWKRDFDKSTAILIWHFFRLWTWMEMVRWVCFIVFRENAELYLNYDTKNTKLWKNTNMFWFFLLQIIVILIIDILPNFGRNTLSSYSVGDGYYFCKKDFLKTAVPWIPNVFPVEIRQKIKWIENGNKLKNVKIGNMVWSIDHFRWVRRSSWPTAWQSHP